MYWALLRGLQTRDQAPGEQEIHSCVFRPSGLQVGKLPLVARASSLLRSRRLLTDFQVVDGGMRWRHGFVKARLPSWGSHTAQSQLVLQVVSPENSGELRRISLLEWINKHHHCQHQVIVLEWTQLGSGQCDT